MLQLYYRQEADLGWVAVVPACQLVSVLLCSVSGCRKVLVANGYIVSLPVHASAVAVILLQRSGVCCCFPDQA